MPYNKQVIPKNMKKFIVYVWLIVLLTAISGFFWYNSWIYHLPTPVPAHYHAVQAGSIIKLNNTLLAYNNKPLFLHFFNPECPCSRFNMASFKALYNQYNGQLNFVVIVMTEKKYTGADIQQKFGLDIPVMFDGSIATACGVYSTPQAVLINTNHTLYYRGNYNKSRYCTDEKTSFAKQAIIGLLTNNTRLKFSRFALTAYGCRLPNCTK